MRPLNSYIVCRDIDSDKTETDSGFQVTTAKRFKEVEILASSEDDIKVGEIAKIPVASGEPDEGNLIIRRQDIIYIK